MVPTATVRTVAEITVATDLQINPTKRPGSTPGFFLTIRSMPPYLPIQPGIEGTALFGGRRKQYRYRLSRLWEPTRPTILFVMMNPSVADRQQDDRTIRRCIAFAKAWNYGQLLVGNVFAYRCTDQKRLLETEDPIGKDNDAHLLAMAASAEKIICAYGKPHPTLRTRGLAVADLYRANGHTLHTLRLSQDGTPVHPLYLPGDLEPLMWQ